MRLPTIPHPIKTLKAKRAAKKLAEREALKAELQKELDRKTVEQITDEATKERIKAELSRKTQERRLERSAAELESSQNRFSRTLDRWTKGSDKMNRSTTWLLVFVWAVMVFLLGVAVGNEKSDFADYFTSIFFVLFFGLMLGGKLWDFMHEAAQGRKAHLERKEEVEKHELNRKLERAKEEGRKEALQNQTAPAPAGCGHDHDEDDDDDDVTLEDLADMILEDEDAPQELKKLARVLRAIGAANEGDHDGAMKGALQMVVAEVVDAKTEALGGEEAARESGWMPGEEEAAEIKRRFLKLTGHTVEIEHVPGRGWKYKISETGTRHPDFKGHEDAVDAAALAAQTTKKKPLREKGPKKPLDLKGTKKSKKQSK